MENQTRRRWAVLERGLEVSTMNNRKRQKVGAGGLFILSKMHPPQRPRTEGTTRRVRGEQGSSTSVQSTMESQHLGQSANHDAREGPPNMGIDPPGAVGSGQWVVTSGHLGNGWASGWPSAHVPLTFCPGAQVPAFYLPPRPSLPRA